MTLEDNKKIVLDFIEQVINDKKPERIADFISKDFINHSRNAVPGIEGVRQYFGILARAFPDRKVTITQVLAENDLVSIYTEWTGTHQDIFLNFPATGKPVTVFTADLYRIKDHLITEHWDVVNNTEMMITLGALQKKP